MIIFLILLLTPSLALTHCTCPQLYSQQDCLASTDYTCAWDSNTSTCSINSNTPVVVTEPTYCSQQTVCSSTTGCAFVDNKCIAFSGCSAYVYTTKEECQSVSTLCISNGVHCVELSACPNYKTQTACSQNKNGNYCYWNDDACIDPVECSQLPSILDSDLKCRNQLSKCTVAESGKGCVDGKLTCQDYKYQAACVQRQYGLCYWTTESTCVDRKCPNAPTTYNTDSQCLAFEVSCTTKANGGCQARSLCTTATIQAACTIGVDGLPCYWAETVCITKQCKNAPNTYITDKQCKQIDSNCITNGGGCLVQATCSSGTIEAGCVDMADGTKCFWTGTECKTKTCVNATNISSVDQCTSYLPTCTINSTGNGCVVKTCETSLTQPDCGSKCLWMSQCYEKKCSLASTSFTTFNDCNGYLSTCTVSNSGYGCMIMGLSCAAYLSQASCTKIQSGAYCGWDGNKCVDRQCSMAQTTITTASDCQAYKSDCILTNSGQGCMDIPLTCSDRKLQNNCEYGTNPICVWLSNQCVQKSCETAQLMTVNSTTCAGYLSGCIVNNQGDGCRTLPLICNLLSVVNCQTAQSGNCFWSGGQCKEFICTNIIKTNHSDCNNELNTCTVNNNGTACMNIYSRCSMYSSQTQCYQSTISLCYWTGLYCVDYDCVNATDTVTYQSHQQCQLINSKCTVLNKVNQSGCVNRLSNCSDYKYQYQCVKTLNQVDCIWNNNQCFDKSLFTCGNIKVNTYNNANCESVLFNCKANISTNGCISKICTDYTYTTKVDCEAVSGCTINKAATGCIIKQMNCSQYTNINECKYSNEGECGDNGTICYYIKAECSSFASPADDTACSNYRPFCTLVPSAATCSNRTCSSYSGTINNSNCLAYDKSCAATFNLSGCFTMTSLCYGILTPDTKNDQNHCTYSLNEGRCAWNSNTSVCVPFGVATQQNCFLSSNLQATIDYQACQELSTFCSVNRSGTQCVNLKPQCSDYITLAECVQSTSGLCIQNQQNDTGATCINIPSTISCNKLYRGNSFVYTHSECSKMKNTCTNDGSTGCQDKTCSKMLNTHADCESWLSTCTVNATFTQCTNKSQTCLEQSNSSCLYAIEGPCAVINGRCRKMICENASNGFTTDAQCNNYLNKCTVARIGGCMTKQSICSNYVTQINCKSNYSNQECFWNPYNEQCVDSKCEQIEQSTNFDTHDKCYNASLTLKCTISSTGSGCVSLGICTNYTNQSQCVVDQNGKSCVWSTTCQYKSCDTAPIAYTTHLDCQNYDSTCTLKVDGGCQQLKSCVEYFQESQCIIDDKGKDCGWATDHCIIKSCITAPLTVTTNDACQNYLSGCMVASSGQGCVDKPKTCEEIQNENQCALPCYWNGSKCITKSCDNAPSDIDTAAECSGWLSQCTLDDTFKCKSLACDHYTFKTDAECKAAMSTCTTDGSQCVQRGTCAQALGILGCTTSINNEQCYWVGKYCTIKVCNVVTSQTDCTTASDGTKCVWDNNKCRNIGLCVDYSGTTTQQCQSINPLCMAGQNGKCTDLMNCSTFTTKGTCLIGLDGPCLWIANKCYQYNSCQSLQWKTDQECKQISSQCTTDGTQCVSLTQCSETNTNGGCVTGNDGECMQTVPSLKSTEQPVCKLFTQCNDAYYLTHKECQTANKKCTTNGLTNCMSLTNCTSYSRMESCVIDDQGVQYQDSQIISTGICVWDGTQCKNQSCSNLSGITNEQCQSQLSTCTTDGSTCILKLSCSQYKQSICQVGYGTEGKCNWMDATGTCELLMCSTIDGGITLAACQSKLPNCISDGTACIEKDQCSRYLTKTACNTGGTDGICVWNLTSKTCSLMTSCTQADNDQNACLQAVDRCSYSYATNNASSSCSTHTCDTYLKSNGLCKSFYNWNKSQKTLCQLNVNKCVTTDPTTLDSSTCFSISEYTYSWNISQSKCQSCLQSTINTSNTNNTTATTTQTNNTPETTVQYSQTLFIGMLIILI